jgi:hypothetical protein
MGGTVTGFLVSQGFFRLNRWWSGLVVVLLLAFVCFGSPEVSHAAWRLPKRQGAAPTSVAPSVRAASAHLQEVSPPVAVRQFKDAVGEKLPQLEILEPANGTMVADGTWTLRVKVSDWPLIDGGPLGLGPHLLVILDSEPPRVITAPQTEMPPLSPGSHRLTVAAAWPWGEVIKSHGSFDQIRLYRASANPLSVPVPGSAQLLVTSSSLISKYTGNPVLLDWLLIDAPLQNLRQDDASWRLRITANGESFLVDQQTPLWISGWAPGDNALLWELVDGRGEALNPPFNSIVSELNVGASSGSNSPWLNGRIKADDLAILLGNASPVSIASNGEKEVLNSISIQPDKTPPLVQGQGLNSNPNQTQNGVLNVLPYLPSGEVATGESPGDPGHDVQDGQLDSGPSPAVSAEPMDSDAEEMTIKAPSLISPHPDPLPVVPSKPEAPLPQVSSMTSLTGLPERDRAVTSRPDNAPGSQDLKDIPALARDLVNPYGTMVPPPSGGFLAGLSQGFRRLLGPS